MPTPAADFSVFDAQELVTYEPTGESPVANVAAVRRPLTQSRQRNVERYVQLEATDVVFHLDGEPLTATPLSAGDSLTDSNDATYQVLFVERHSFNGTVATVCRPSGS